MVSIIVPSFNHEKYIEKCIESIMNQSYKDFNLIVVDDGSTDGSRGVIERLQIKHSFKVIFQENLGLVKTLNNCISNHCNSEYITICASDDYWDEKKLEHQVNYMELNPKVLMCFGKCKYVNENNEILVPTNHNFKDGWIFDDIFTLKYHLPVSYFFRSEVFDRIGLYDENIFAEDFDMNLRIASISPIGFIDEFLVYYRFVEITSKLNRYDRIIESHLITIDKFQSHILYSMAKKKALLGRLYAYSTLKTKKIKSIYLFFKLREFFVSKTYIRSLYNFIFIWR
jgi:alpha-1,3-rhamnosyltransferase